MGILSSIGKVALGGVAGLLAGGGSKSSAPPPETIAADAAVAKNAGEFTTAASNNVGGMNVANYANQLVGDPSAFFTNDMQMANRVPDIDPNATGTAVDGSQSKFAVDPGALAINAAGGNVSTVAQIDPQATSTFSSATSADRISQPANTMDAAQGTVRPEAIVEADQLDTVGMATGVNADGTRNTTGEALNKSASLNISNVIDTSTVSGKMLAESLGEGNYTDAKATLKGQLDILSKDFVDPVTGETKIPTWAAGAARAVSRIAAFKGITGTSGTAAMAQAIMEASIPVAQQDAQFFQTVSLKNLDNKQQQTINTANILSKMELTNLDVRMQTAVENSKNFMQMDMANLSNDQQARAVNTQARVQSILEDTKQENTARMFNAQSTNEMNKFYDTLRSSIDQYSSSQKNSMEQFNAGQTNSVSEFNSTIENSRQKFYQEMQYNIDVSNAKWRQSVTTANAEMSFQAAATDVKNLVGVSVEQLNQIWDRSDALLDYTFKNGQNEADRTAQIGIAKMNAQIERDKIKAQKSGGFGKILGSVIGAVAGSALPGIGTAIGAKLGGKIVGKAVGAAVTKAVG